MTTNFLTRYNHANPVSPSGGDITMTDQQYKADCDLNEIVKLAGLGKTPVVRAGIFGDFSEIGDFASVLDKVERAKSDFESLPAAVRDRFGNDPRKFASFCMSTDENDISEAIRLGIRTPPEPKDNPVVDLLKSIDSKLTPNGANPA